MTRTIPLALLIAGLATCSHEATPARPVAAPSPPAPESAPDCPEPAQPKPGPVTRHLTECRTEVVTLRRSVRRARADTPVPAPPPCPAGRAPADCPPGMLCLPEAAAMGLAERLCDIERERGEQPSALCQALSKAKQ